MQRQSRRFRVVSLESPMPRSASLVIESALETVADFGKYTPISPKTWLYHKKTGETYQITLRDNGDSCTCPSRVVCKHIYGAHLLRLMLYGRPDVHEDRQK